jgi:hypothetical protein
VKTVTCKDVEVEDVILSRYLQIESAMTIETREDSGMPAVENTD